MKNFESWRFGVQVFFSTIVIGLCIFKLCTADAKDNPNTAIYWGGLTGVLGYWLPSPNSDDKEKQKKQFDSVVANLNNESPNQPTG
ncbi:hypothetical protein IQ264_01695 [Phormidium sp. LEGE 05292]|uniref:hypothetical protein n=1 Tax=[Phormidium] sp. LEGE 05292 TaxID=767427 RepID=UPI001882848F|nr:hypothetical protein [Phormidium sp. LEGE 05292]MBE9224186.1 hypothetical protein [Phormidium sp. LEGE 05292]